MNISFDLDSTLIPNGKEFATENRSRLAKLLGVEEIRKGSAKLLPELQHRGHKVHIYTTYFRSGRKIRRTLWYYGIKVNSIVTQTQNVKMLRALNIQASKYPVAFGFDVHIDDSKGVGIEGEKWGFKTIIIDPQDDAWEEKIKQLIENY